MGPRHSRERLLEGALQVVLESGLSRLSFGRVAAHLGISDRTVVYYFPTKEQLAADVVAVLGHRLQTTLDVAVDGPAPDHIALLRAAWPVLTHPDADRTFALFFEAVGLAAAGRRPYDTLVPALVDGWIDWAADHLTGPAAERQAEARATVAVADGLLLLRRIAGPDAAASAARRLGVA
jgi:AcrR family transcriptional regulator